MRCRHYLLATLALSGSAMGAYALEATANKAMDVDASLGMKVDAANAAITAVINQMLACSKQDKDFVADASVPGRDANGCVARATGGDGAKCTTANKIYDPTDSAADGDGCVAASIVPEAVTKSANITINSYPGAVWGSRGWSGSGYASVSLQDYVDDGATAFAINGSRAGGVCNGAYATITIANASTSYSGGNLCHYDSSPNRNLDFNWSYNGSTKTITFESRMYQHGVYTQPVITANLVIQYTAQRLKFGKD